VSTGGFSCTNNVFGYKLFGHVIIL
jgi:hypothetical protein